MKKYTFTQVLALSAVLLLPCLAFPVKSHLSLPQSGPTILSDGVPLPPPVPNPPPNGITGLVADGVPLPPPVPNPPPNGISNLVADGVPLPPPVPNPPPNGITGSVAPVTV
jgi:hypothetical protein